MSSLIHQWHRVLAVGCLALSAFSCGGDLPIGANAGRIVSLNINPVFQAAGGAAGVVQFERVRVLILRADGSIAVDRMVDFPAGVDEISLLLDVPLSPTAPPTGEEFQLNLEMLNAVGEVVFRGGPSSVRARQGTPLPPVDIPTQYSGPGATAVRVTLDRTDVQLEPAATVTLTATAFDAAGAPLPSTPVQWTSSNPAVARLADPTQGVVTAGAVRGDATITARLVTGQIATAQIRVRLIATAIARVSGNGQSCAVGDPLAAPLVVRVTSATGAPVDGVPVTFRVVSGGGTLGSASVTTGLEGTASTTFTAGNRPGVVQLEASADGLTGSPIAFSVTCAPGAPSQLVFVTSPTDGVVDQPLSPFTVEVQDRFENRVSTATGAVSLTLLGASAGVTLGGPTSADVTAGRAMFSGVTVSGAASALRIRATMGAGITPAESAPFNIAPPAPRTGDVSGTVVDGRTGNAVSAATVVLTSSAGQDIAAVSTTGGGVFTVPDVPAGDYTLSVSATGYATASQSITVVAAQTTTVNVALSSSQASGTVSIVLTWGAEPRDMDSHLYPQGGARVFYGNQGDCAVACLDRDDTDGFGPETMTIKVTASTLWTYGVYNYSGTGTFSGSPARVQVYVGNTLVRTYDAPSGTGRWWTLFRLRNGTIEDVNTISDVDIVPASLRAAMQAMPRKMAR